MPLQQVSHAGLAGGGQQLSGGGAAVEAQHLFPVAPPVPL